MTGEVNFKLLICAGCYRLIQEHGLSRNHPQLVMEVLVRSGHAEKPEPLAYVRHAEWRRIWMAVFDRLGIEISDEFAAIAAIKKLEARLYEQATEAADEDDEVAF